MLNPSVARLLLAAGSGLRFKIGLLLRYASFLAPPRRKKSPDDSDQGVTGERCGGRLSALI
jgi:hypothetical protein